MQLARCLGMRSAYLGALALTLVTSIFATVGCSSATKLAMRQLIGGTAASQHYAAAGALAGETNGTFCTATLVTKNVIVTAMYRKFKPPFFLPGAISPARGVVNLISL